MAARSGRSSKRAAATNRLRREIERAARDIAAAGAVIEPLGPFLTQEMLDGLDRFWRMRSLIDLAALPAEKRAKALPFIRDLG